jgi:tetratricopeptide (TPR) repeat protein
VAELRRNPSAAGATLGDALESLAMTLLDERKLPEAESASRESLEVAIRLLGPDHPSVATGKDDLAAILDARGDKAEAEALYREALAMRRRRTPDGPDVAESLNNLALFLKKQGKFDEALPLYEECLKSDERNYGPANPVVGRTLLNLGSLQLARGDEAAAERCYRRALEIWRTALPPGHRNIGMMARQLASLMLRQRRFGEAEPLLRDAIPIIDAAQMPRWEGAYTRAMLGSCIAGAAQKDASRFPEAESLLRSGLVGLDSSSPGEPAPVSKRKQVLRWLLDLYTAWERPERAAEISASLDALESAPK